MKARLLLVLVLVLPLSAVPAPTLGAVPTPASESVTKAYGDFTKTGFYDWLGEADWWDIVRCDLVISYKLDMSEHSSPVEDPIWSLVGLWGKERELGWMASGAPLAADSDPAGFDLDDKLNLSAPPDRFDEKSYDATGPDTIVSTPIGTSYSYGIWFDRDGISPDQVGRWAMRDGQTYNTGGRYTVTVTFHAISPTLGTMFATVNGVQTGFYETFRDGEPDYYPAGKSISGDMDSARGFVFLDGVNVRITDLTISGCAWPQVYIPLVMRN